MRPHGEEQDKGKRKKGGRELKKVKGGIDAAKPRGVGDTKPHELFVLGQRGALLVVLTKPSKPGRHSQIAARGLARLDGESIDPTHGFFLPLGDSSFFLPTLTHSYGHDYCRWKGYCFRQSKSLPASAT